MTWWDGRICAFDLETTAQDPEVARIVTACVVFVGGGEATEQWTAMADPGVEIPEEAAAIHGVTTEIAQRDGQAPATVIQAIFEELLRRQEGSPLVIVNARYDLTVLDREMRRHCGLAGLPAVLTRGIVDPLVLDKHLERYRPGSRKLIDTCRFYNVELGGAHDAAFDAIAGARLAYRLGSSGRIVRRCRGADERREFIELTQEWNHVRGDLDLLHDFEKRIAWAEAERLERYFHTGNPSKGVPPQPDRVVPREWPMIPWPSSADPGRELTTGEAETFEQRRLMVDGDHPDE